LTILTGFVCSADFEKFGDRFEMAGFPAQADAIRLRDGARTAAANSAAR
jgi:hypothetical protein